MQALCIYKRSRKSDPLFMIADGLAIFFTFLPGGISPKGLVDYTKVYLQLINSLVS
jgi:hypothetical protein